MFFYTKLKVIEEEIRSLNKKVLQLECSHEESYFVEEYMYHCSKRVCSFCHKDLEQYITEVDFL